MDNTRAILTVFEPSKMNAPDAAKVESLMRQALTKLVDSGNTWPHRHLHAFVTDDGEEFRLEYAEGDLPEDEEVTDG